MKNTRSSRSLYLRRLDAQGRSYQLTFWFDLVQLHSCDTRMLQKAKNGSPLPLKWGKSSFVLFCFVNQR